MSELKFNPEDDKLIQKAKAQLKANAQPFFYRFENNQYRIFGGASNEPIMTTTLTPSDVQSLVDCLNGVFQAGVAEGLRWMGLKIDPPKPDPSKMRFIVKG